MSMLLETSFQGGSSASFYDYDKYGRLVSLVDPTGSKMMIRSRSDQQGVTVYVDVNREQKETVSGVLDIFEAFGSIVNVAPGYIYDEIHVKKGKSIESKTLGYVSTYCLHASEIKAIHQNYKTNMD